MKKKLVKLLSGLLVCAMAAVGVLTLPWVEAAEVTTPNEDGVYVLTDGDTLDLVIYHYGDVNRDGNINSADTSLMNRSLLPTTHPAYRPLDADEFAHADVVLDEKVNSADTSAVNRSLLPTTHPAYKPIQVGN